MAVRKRGKVYWVDFSYNGCRYRKPSPDRSYKGAIAFELFLRNKLAHGETLKQSTFQTNLTFQKFALQWLEVYVRNNNKRSEYKNRQYLLNATLFPYFGTKKLEEISTYDIEQFKNDLLYKKDLSPKTINNYLCILSRCLKSAMEWELLKQIPNIKLMKVPPQKYDYLSDEETEVLLQQAKGTSYDMILLAVRTGLRFGELIALKWDDVDLDKAILTVSRNISRGIEGSPKNNKIRSIPLSFTVIKMLKNRERCSEYIFPDKKGLPLQYTCCRLRLKKLCEKANLRTIGWHTLRHSFASHLAAHNNSVIAIKELLGHSDVKTTMRYAHPNILMLQSAIKSLETGPGVNVTIASQPRYENN
jgi:integrase